MGCKGCGKKINTPQINTLQTNINLQRESKLPISNYENTNNTQNISQINNSSSYQQKHYKEMQTVFAREKIKNKTNKINGKDDVRLTVRTIPDDGFCFFDWYQSISVNNLNTLFLNFDRWSPNLFRYHPSTYSSYEDYFNSEACPQQQLYSGNIKFFNLVTIFFKLLPLKSESIQQRNLINNDRNIFFSFILSLERAYFKYKVGETYCQKQKVPWPGYFALNFSIFPNESLFNSENFPLTLEQQAGFYEIAMNKITFDESAQSVFKKCSDINSAINKIDYDMNFYKIIKIGYSLLETLVFYSEQVIQGKQTGIPCGLEKELFPIEFCYYYYDLYYNIVKQRSENLGFKNYFTNGTYNFVNPRKI